MVQFITVQNRMVELGPCSTLQYCTEQYSVVYYGIVQYRIVVQQSTLKYSLVQYSVLQYSIVRTVQYSKVYYTIVQCSIVQLVQYSVVQCSTVQYRSRGQYSEVQSQVLRQDRKQPSEVLKQTSSKCSLNSTSMSPRSRPTRRIQRQATKSQGKTSPKTRCFQQIMLARFAFSFFIAFPNVYYKKCGLKVWGGTL